MTSMHFYLQSFESEQLFWSDVLDYFKRLEILDLMSSLMGVSSSLFNYLGMHLAYDFSV